MLILERIYEENCTDHIKLIEMFEVQQWIFQQRNVANNTAQRLKQWFTDNYNHVLNLPDLCQDLNIIENVWRWLLRKIDANETGTRKK